MRVLITAPEILARIGEVDPIFRSNGIVAVTPMPCAQDSSPCLELIDRLDHLDGWIFGDEEISNELLETGVKRGLRAAVKWGRGLANVDLESARSMALFITDSPEVPDADFHEQVRRVVLQLRRRFDLKTMIQKGATRALHQRFSQFEI